MRNALTCSLCAMLMWLAAPAGASADVVYALAPPYFIVQIDTANPATLLNVVAVSNLALGERIEAIDFRPRTGELLGLGVIKGSSDSVRVLRIDPLTGYAVPIGGRIAVAAGTGYGFDLNPRVDRIRAVNGNDTNFRLNPNTGTLAGLDTALSPSGYQVRGAAYDRSFDAGLTPSVGTTLYGISVATSSVLTIGSIDGTPTSPNTGQLMNVIPITGLTGSIASGSEVGFDIAAGSNKAFAALRDGSGLTRLFTLSLTTGAATLVGPIGNGAFDVTGLAVVPANTVAFGAGAGGGPHVRGFDPHTGQLTHEFFAYDPSFYGGVRVATGDVNRDGIPDILTAPGPGGGPHVKVVNGATGGLLYSFFAYPANFYGGLFVAAGDINNDGYKDIIVGPDRGGPHLRAFSGLNGAMLLELFPYHPAFGGGVRVASADFDLDGDYEIVTAPGAGGGPQIRVFDGAGAPFTGSLPNSFFAYPPEFTGGVFVAAGDVTGDGVPDIVTGAGEGGGPHVRVFSGVNGALVMQFFAYELTFTGGVRVAVGDVNADGRYDIITMSGPGRIATVTAVDGVTGQLLMSAEPYGAFAGGAYVGGVRR
jgi:hypothetical protein